MIKVDYVGDDGVPESVRSAEKEKYGGLTEEEFYEKHPNAFRKGVSGNPSGRSIKVVNRKTARQIAEDMEFNPVEAAIRIIQESPESLRALGITEAISTTQKLKLLMWVGDKMFASVKAVDMALDTGNKEGEKDNRVQIYMPELGSSKNPQEIANETGKSIIEIDGSEIQAVDVPIQK